MVKPDFDGRLRIITRNDNNDMTWCNENYNANAIAIENDNGDIRQ